MARNSLDRVDSLDRVADHSCGKVWHRPPDSRLAAIRSPTDRSAIGDHKPGVKRDADLYIVAAHRDAQADHNRGAHSLAAVHNLVALRNWVAPRNQVPQTTVAHIRAEPHMRMAAAHSQAVGLHLQLRRDQEMFLARTALPGRQSQ